MFTPKRTLNSWSLVTALKLVKGFLVLGVVIHYWGVSVQAALAPAAAKLTVIATTDWHGHFVDKFESFALDVLKAKQENPDGVILLDAGDVFQGTVESNYHQGQAMVELYNTIGMDGVAIGNHEFDYGIEQLVTRLAESKSYFLSANIVPPVHDDKVKLVPPAYRVLKRNGLKVLVFGLTTISTPYTTKSKNVTGYQFADLEGTVLKDLKALKQYHKPDVTIVVAHAGLICASPNLKTDLADCSPDDEFTKLEKVLPPGLVDLMVGGHTHKVILRQTEKTTIVEGGSYGKHFVKVDWSDVRANKKPKIALHDIVPVASNSLNKTNWNKQEKQVLSAIREISKRYTQEVDLIKAQKVTQFANDCVRGVYNQESGIGQLLTDSLRKHYKADLAFYNAGGIRQDVKAGVLNFGQLYEVLPFDNYAIKATLTGAEINELFSKIYSRAKKDQSGLMQISGAKIFLKYDQDQNFAYDYATFENGTALEMDRKYTVMVNDFLVLGGDAFKAVTYLFNDSNQQALEKDSLRDIVNEELSKQSIIQCPVPAQNPRIVFPSDS